MLLSVFDNVGLEFLRIGAKQDAFVKVDASLIKMQAIQLITTMYI